MRTRTMLLPLVISLVTASVAAFWVDSPGFTDADYYMATGARLALGDGFTQPFIWNYLAAPQQLPTPSHLYWMPLPSLVAAFPMLVLGVGFRVAQLPFLLLTILLAPACAALGWWVTSDERSALLSGILAAFSGFFLPFFVTTETFVLYAWLGGGSLWLAASHQRTPSRFKAIGLGVAIGLAHLTRADGVVLLVPATMGVLGSGRERKSDIFLLGLGYLLVMLPWMTRLQFVSGSPLPLGASRTIWLRSYNELFSYPATKLDAANLLDAGAAKLVSDRLGALAQNLFSFVIVTGLIVVSPLAVIGGWSLRHKPIVPLVGAYLILLLTIMSFVFPFPGPRGGFFHSSTALLPPIWALAPSGLDRVLAWASQRRQWEFASARARFGLGLATVAAVATVFLMWQRLVAPSLAGGGWGASKQSYEQVGLLLEAQGASRVAVNNPPGFWLATGLEAVVIPDGDSSTLLDVVRDYEVDWVVLDRNHPDGLIDLYNSPGSDPHFEWVETVESGVAAPIYLLKVGP